MADLERNQEALVCFEKAVELEPDHEWAPIHRRRLEETRRIPKYDNEE